MTEGQKPEERADLEHGRLPDPEAKAISCLFDQIRALERKVQELAEAQDRQASIRAEASPVPSAEHA
jgi:serine O-acetyltransferase